MRAVTWAVLLGLGAIRLAVAAPPEVAVGSKKFTESVVLGEVATQLARGAGASAVHRAELGGTRLAWRALLAGELDAYAEYTGTIATEILGGAAGNDLEALRAALRERGVVLGGPLGFNNTYALGLTRPRAAELRVSRISDLVRHADLRFGFTNEFMDRPDGWPGLRAHYRLPQTDVRGLDHDVAYRGLLSGSLDATDLYSTDAEIREHDLVILDDDGSFFPRYEAVLLWRVDLESRAPDVVAAWRSLEGRLPAEEMVALNARARLDRVPEAEVAAGFLAEAGLEGGPDLPSRGLLHRLVRHGREHLALTGVSLGAAILVAVPLGVLAARRRRLGRVVLGLTGAIQTVPSLALLVVLVPLLGIGAPPAILALFLYSLLPIVRTTHSGLTGIDPALRESADALGLPAAARLRRVDLPLAAPSILAGIKTSAVINVGTATLGALVGAGGYGQPILTGIRLDDASLILQGALPAAGLALLVQAAFDGLERLVVPAGLRS